MPDISNVDLKSRNLSGVDFSRANLSGANLSWANLIGSDLSGADLTRANLFWADLYGTNLSKANLSWADLYGTDLSRANLSEADFKNCCFVHTSIGDVDLREAKNLEKVIHDGPSHIDIHTIYRSEGIIPEPFLRGCGVPENLIQYMSSLTGKAFDFYSCFISYSSKNQNFAQRLYADLQNKGVRCWFAPEDMKIGDKIRDRIDQTIKTHDKLLLVLSEHSIDSDWVEDEVETAYEQERRRGKSVLFPIKLDNAVMDTDKAWAAKLGRSKHIGDFTKWEDHDSYQKAFERLMRDLKAEKA